MTAIISLSVDDSEIQEAFTQLARKTGDLKPALKNIGEYLVKSTLENFDSETDPQGTAWAPLTQATIKRKQKKGKINKILQQDGDLRQTIIYQVGETEVEVGTNRIYGAIHQFGGWAGKNRSVYIPARPYLGVNETDLTEITTIIQDHLDIS